MFGSLLSPSTAGLAGRYILAKQTLSNIKDKAVSAEKRNTNGGGGGGTLISLCVLFSLDFGLLSSYKHRLARWNNNLHAR